MHLTDAAAAGNEEARVWAESESATAGAAVDKPLPPGPYFPLTNAPRRGGASSVQFSTVDAFESLLRSESSSAAPGSPSDSVVTLPADEKAITQLGGRAWAFPRSLLLRTTDFGSGSTLADQDVFTINGDPQQSDLHWMRQWVHRFQHRVSDGLKPRLVLKSFVRYEALTDLLPGGVTFPWLEEVELPL